MKKRLLSAFLVLAMVLTLLPSAALAAPNDTEFHINGIQAMKDLVAEKLYVDVDDVTIHSVDIHGAKKNVPNKGDPAVATGGTLYNKYTNVGDLGAQGTNGRLTGYDDIWMVLNTSNVIDEESVDAITIYAKTGTWWLPLVGWVGGEKLDPVTVYLADGAIKSEQLDEKLITSIDVTSGSLTPPVETTYSYTVNYYWVNEAGNETKSETVDSVTAEKISDGPITPKKAAEVKGYQDGTNYVLDTDKTGDLTWTSDKQIFNVYYAVDANNNGTPDYQETKYTLTYDANGAEGKIASSEHYAGDRVELENGATLGTKDDGIFFLGWTQGENVYTATNPAEQEPVDVTLLEGYVTLDEDITVYAAWAKDENNNNTPDYEEPEPEPELETVNLVIYRNGNTTEAYQTVSLEPAAKGEPYDLSRLEKILDENYTPNKFAVGYEYEGWYNDGGWNQYKKGDPDHKLGDSITINGWTNIICMVWDKYAVNYHIGDSVRSETFTIKDFGKDLWSPELEENQTLNGWYETPSDLAAGKNPHKLFGWKLAKLELYGEIIDTVVAPDLPTEDQLKYLFGMLQADCSSEGHEPLPTGLIDGTWTLEGDGLGVQGDYCIVRIYTEKYASDYNTRTEYGEPLHSGETDYQDFVLYYDDDGDRWINSLTEPTIRLICDATEGRVVTVRFVDVVTQEEVGDSYTLGVPAGENNLNTSRITDVPEGYELASVGDLPIGDDNVVTAWVRRTAPSEEQLKILFGMLQADCSSEGHEPLTTGLINGTWTLEDDGLGVQGDYCIVRIYTEKYASDYDTRTGYGEPLHSGETDYQDFVLYYDDDGDRWINSLREPTIRLTCDATEGRVVTVRFVDVVTQEEVGDSYTLGVPAGENNLNTSRITDVPEDYELASVGDLPIGDDNVVTAWVRRTAPSEEQLKILFGMLQADCFSEGHEPLPTGLIDGTWTLEGDGLGVQGDYCIVRIYTEKYASDYNTRTGYGEPLHSGETDYQDFVLYYDDDGDRWINSLREPTIRLTCDATEGRVVTVRFVDVVTQEEVGDSYTLGVPAGENNLNTSRITDVPEDYELASVGDLPIGDDNVVTAWVRRTAPSEEQLKILFGMLQADCFSEGHEPLPTGLIDGTWTLEGDGLGVQGDYCIVRIYTEKYASDYNTRTEYGEPLHSGVTDYQDFVLYHDGIKWINDLTEPTIRLTCDATEGRVVTVRFVDVVTQEEVGDSYTLGVPAGENNLNTSRITDVPEGYELASVGDLPIGDDNVVTAWVRRTAPTNLEALLGNLQVDCITDGHDPIETGLLPDSYTVTGDGLGVQGDEYVILLNTAPYVEEYEERLGVSVEHTATSGDTMLIVLHHDGIKWSADGWQVKLTCEPAPEEGKTLRIFWAIDDSEHADFTYPAGGSDTWTETISWDDRGNTFVFPELTVADGYVLAGWTGGGETSAYWSADEETFEIPESMIVEDENGGYLSITAHIVKDSGEEPQPDTYTLTYDANYSGGRDEDYDYEVGEDGSVRVTVEENMFRRSGYTFTGWNTRANGNGTDYEEGERLTLTGDLTLYAQWRKNGSTGTDTTSYTIDASASRGGDISPEGRVFVARGNDRTFRITADEGYVIDDVRVDGESVGAVRTYTFENVRRDHTIEVIFVPDGQQTVAYGPDDTGVSDWLNVDDHVSYLNGYPGGLFGPNDNMTRAEVAQMFYNLLLNQNVTVTVSFADVSADAWYAQAVNALASLGIVQGVGDGMFAPERTITRAEFTVIAMRFAELPTGGTNPFSDVRTSDWFYAQVVGAAQYGWITGYTNGTFGPNNTITRAEVTAIVNRMLSRSADEDFVDDNAAELVRFNDVSDTYWAYYDIMEATNSHEYEWDNNAEEWTDLA